MTKGMEVITQRDIIRNVLNRHKEQYPDRNKRYWDGRTVAETQDKLAALDLNTCTSEDVDKAVGAPGWGDNNCDFCDRNVDVLIRIGDQPDYEARWVDICPDCLREAHAALELVQP